MARRWPTPSGSLRSWGPWTQHDSASPILRRGSRKPWALRGGPASARRNREAEGPWTLDRSPRPEEAPPQSLHPAQGPWACLARACRPGGARFSPAWTGDPLSGPLES